MLTPSVVSMTVQVLRVVFTSIPKNRPTSQKPESLTCDRTVAPAAMASTSATSWRLVGSASATPAEMRPAVVVSATEGSGTFVASLVNGDLEEPDALTELTGEGVQAEITGQLQVEPEALLNLSQTGAVEVTGEDIAPGKFVEMTLTFESGQETTMRVPVVRDDEEFAEVKLAGPSESASPSPGESESPGAEESASPGAEESGSPAPGESESPAPDESETTGPNESES